MLAELKKPWAKVPTMVGPVDRLRPRPLIQDPLVLLAGLGVLYFLIYEHSQWQPLPGEWPIAVSRVPVPAVLWYTGGWLLFAVGLWATVRARQPVIARTSDLIPRRLALILASLALGFKVASRLTGVGLIGLENRVPVQVLIAGAVVCAVVLLLLLRWPPPTLVVFALLILSGLLTRVVAIQGFQEDPALADNLVVVRLGLERLASGSMPYGLFNFGDHASPMAYLPWTFLSYLPPFLLGLDIRWANVVASLALTLALGGMLYLLPLHTHLRNGLLLAIAFFFVLPRNVGNDLNSEFPPFNLAIVVTFGLIVLGHWRAAAAAFGVALGSMPVALFCIGPLFMYAIRRRGWRDIPLLALIAAAFAMAPAVLFLAWDAPMFVGAVLGDAREALDASSRMVSNEPYLLLWHRLPPDWLRAIQFALFAGTVWLSWSRLRSAHGLVALGAAGYLALVLSSPLIMPHYFAVVLYLAVLAVAVKLARSGDSASLTPE